MGSAEGADNDELKVLVQDRGHSPLGVPYRDGYDFAEDLLDDLGLGDSDDSIDVEKIAERLEVVIENTVFDSRDIRGVALAGEGIQPRIILNKASVFNASDEGCRFTIAHELCHILHDRSRARRVTHVSGPWVGQGFERRANAFAAYLLMPRSLVIRSLGSSSAGNPDTIQRVAHALEVSESALAEHLYNLRLIGDTQREELRRSFRKTRH